MKFEKGQIVTSKRSSLDYVVIGKNKKGKVIALPVGEEDGFLNRGIFKPSDLKLKSITNSN